MLIAIRRWGLGVLFALLAAWACAALAQPAQQPRRTAANGRSLACRAAALTLRTDAHTVRRINQRIIKTLDAKRYAAAAVALRRAALDHADAWAGNALGDLYAAGLGVPRSSARAFHWYLWSARRGNRFAERRVANAYLNGVGTKANAAAAARWFRRGMAPWQIAVIAAGLGATYARGYLAPSNLRKARYYGHTSVTELRALVREPNAQADYLLGQDYAAGRNVRRDPAAAHRYLCRAVHLGYLPAAAAVLEPESRSP